MAANAAELMARAATQEAAANPMPRPRSEYVSLHARLTAEDINIIEREKIRSCKRSLSAVVDHALKRLIEDTDYGRKGLTIYPSENAIINRRYLISPEVYRQLTEMTVYLGFNVQQILRAAIAKLDRDSKR